MNQSESNLLPNSIQRIRVFLIESCGMKVKPWADVDETLAALHRTMVDKRGCGIFWHGLRRLLTTLAGDLKQRQTSDAGTYVDNEVLDAGTYETLLADIRRAVDSGKHDTWKALTHALPLPTAALLTLLAGVATVGCAESPLRKSPDAAVVQVTDTARAQPVDTPRAQIILPDADPGSVRKYDANMTDAHFQCDGGGCSVEAVMEACGIDPATQQSVQACLNRMKASWRESMGEALASVGCMKATGDLDCFIQMTCINSRSLNSEFDGRICRPIPVYLGVRFT